jgi:nitrate/nitrite transporter NarK
VDGPAATRDLSARAVCDEKGGPRLMVAFGMVMFAISCFMNSFLTHDWGIQQFRWSQLVRAAGQPFMITP